MITFIGLCLVLFSIFASAVLVRMGLFESYVSRPSDWIAVAPFIIGIGCLFYSLWVVLYRWAP